MIIAMCPACICGMHEGHVGHWGKRSPGIIDGEFCRCPGDCAEKNASAFNKVMKQVSTEALSPAARALLDDLRAADGATRDAAIRRVNALMEADLLPRFRPAEDGA